MSVVDVTRIAQDGHRVERRQRPKSEKAGRPAHEREQPDRDRRRCHLHTNDSNGRRTGGAHQRFAQCKAGHAAAGGSRHVDRARRRLTGGGQLLHEFQISARRADDRRWMSRARQRDHGPPPTQARGRALDQQMCSSARVAPSDQPDARNERSKDGRATHWRHRGIVDDQQSGRDMELRRRFQEIRPEVRDVAERHDQLFDAASV
jgi:hypothetical protein